ncbi:MAG TPA: RES family NAD+ phosphorylase [Thermomicrobiales bacterium]|nr:RES family NAD+ phosphorylase [Thermomicrobiales bacterium]
MRRARLSRAVSPLRVVSPPETPIYRVARGLDPFEPRDWRFAGTDGTFGNRFDDPGAARGIPPEERFRVVYCASERVGAFAETLAPLRPSIGVLNDLADVDDDEPLDPAFEDPLITADWRSARRLGITHLAPHLRFVDVAAADTLQHLRVALAPIIRDLGLKVKDLDLSAATSQERRLTQEIARYIYEQTDLDGQALYAGIRYCSRLDARWECWAIYHDRMMHSPEVPETIYPDDEALVRVALLFSMAIETLHGHRIRSLASQ